MSLVLSLSRLVPVLSHGGTGSTLYSLHSPKVEPGVHHVEEDVEIGACVRWRSGSRSEIFLTGVRCGEVIFEGGAKPWSVGVLESVDVVLKVLVGRNSMNGCRCQDKRIRGEVLDGGGVNDAEV